MKTQLKFNSPIYSKAQLNQITRIKKATKMIVTQITQIKKATKMIVKAQTICGVISA